MQAERLGVAAPLPAAPVHEAQPSRLAVLVVPGQRLVERRDVQEVAGPHDVLAAGEGRACVVERRKDEGRKTVLCSVFRAPREYDGEEYSEYSGMRLNTSWETWLGDMAGRRVFRF